MRILTVTSGAKGGRFEGIDAYAGLVGP